MENALSSRTQARVFIREDFNVPLENGKIVHAARIEAALPTLKSAIESGAKIIIGSHLGRPQEGHYDEAYSLRPVADYLSHALRKTILLFRLEAGVPKLAPGEIALLENVRFLKGEADNDPALSKQLATLGDIFVMDAFAVAHRAQASTCGVAHYATEAVAGPLLQKELAALSQVLVAPERPVLAIVGGSKISTKLTLLQHLLDKVDILALGGGIANTFLAAQGIPMGDSLYEYHHIPTAKALIQQANEKGKTLFFPEDVVRTTGGKIVDSGLLAQQTLGALIQTAKTILWNGPVGLFEVPAFSKGTEAVLKAITKTKAFSVAGGGDTLAAIDHFGAQGAFSYLSTGGGAFLESLEGKTLPAVAILKERAVCLDVDVQK